MGIMCATATVRNPAGLDRAWEGEFPVDTGAIDCVVPRKYLEAISLAPLESRGYSLADGSEIRLDITGGVIDSWAGEHGRT